MSLTSILGKIAWFFLHGSWGDKQRDGWTGRPETSGQEEGRVWVYPTPRDGQLDIWTEPENVPRDQAKKEGEGMSVSEGEKKCLLPSLPGKP